MARTFRVALLGVALGLVFAGCRVHSAGPGPAAPVRAPALPLAEASELLRSSRPQDHVRAARALADHGPGAAPAIADLMAFLEDASLAEPPESSPGYAAPATEAALALGAIGPAAEAGLLAALADGSSQVRELAPVALAAMCSRAALPSLIALGDDPSARMRRSALLALGVLGGDEALRAVTGALRHPNPWDRMFAYMILGDTGRPALPHLEAIVAGKDRGRFLAAAALVSIGDPSSAATFRSLREDPDERLREQALFGLARTGDREAVATLFSRLEVDNRSVLQSRIPRILSRVPPSARDAVLQELRSDHAGRRLGAVAALALMPDPDARSAQSVAQPLLDALRVEQDATVRVQIVLALGPFQSRPVLEAFVGLLADSDPLIRTRAVDALAAAGEPPLERILATLADRRPEVRASAAGLLLKIGDERSVVSLLSAAGDSDASVRRYAVQALGAIGDRRAFEVIATAVNDRDALVRQAALQAAGAMGQSGVAIVLDALDEGDPSNFAGLVDGVLSLEELSVEQAARASKALLRVFAVRPYLGEKLYLALGRLGSLPLDPLLGMVREPDDGRRKYAITAIGYLKDPRVIPALIDLLPGAEGADLAALRGALARQGAPAVDSFIAALFDERPAVRSAAAYALGEIGDPRAARTLLTFARDRDGEVRLGVLFALGEFGDPRAIPFIVQGLLSHDPRLRDVALRAARRMRSPLVAETLAIVIPDLHDPPRSEALQSLAPMGKAATASLLALAGHADAGVRRAAIESLTKAQPSEALPAFVNALGDSDASVRVAAAKGLEVLRDNRAVESLGRALTDRDPEVRGAAATALREIGVAEAGPLSAAIAHPDAATREAAQRLLDGGDETIPDDYSLSAWAQRRCSKR